MRTLQRAFWNGQPETLRELFALSKPNGIRATCTLWSHMFGWELRLEVNGTIVRTQFARDFATTETTSDEMAPLHARRRLDVAASVGQRSM